MESLTIGISKLFPGKALELLEIRFNIPVGVVRVSIGNEWRGYNFFVGSTPLARSDCLHGGGARLVGWVRLKVWRELQGNVFTREHGGAAHVERDVILRVADVDGLDVPRLAAIQVGPEGRCQHLGGFCDVWRG